ncbi:hypothetical protein ACFQX7_24605 [Luedemannella flava]
MMLPRTAIPRAMPSSCAVSVIADAAPVRSGGAAATTMSTPSASTGMIPPKSSTSPTITYATAVSSFARLTTSNPIVATTRPTAILVPGLIRRPIIGVTVVVTIPVSSGGTIDSPAMMGDWPATSCRYWALR